MSTYVLIHGAGDVGWYWHLVQADLQGRGHDVVAVDLPVEDDTASLSDYAETVVDAIGGRTDLIVVSQSAGGYTAPIVCDRVPTDLLVLVAPMIPAPGETPAEMFANTGYASPKREDWSDLAVFDHDVEPELAREALSKSRRQSDTPGREPWPLAAWPNVPVRVVLGLNDRLFPARWLRQVAMDRLGVVPDEIDCGHCVALARPRELAALLERYRLELASPGIEGPVDGSPT
jgi:pimeloyl-ACP methyl ester carboxylesterase